MKESTFEAALLAYVRAIHMLDPLRVRYWDDRGLTMPQLLALFILSREDNVPVSYLAEQMRVAPSTISGLTDRLVRENLIKRKDDPSDRRVVRICLTEEGRQIVREVDTVARAYLREVFSKLPEDRLEQLIASLEELVEVEAQVQSEQQMV